MRVFGHDLRTGATASELDARLSFQRVGDRTVIESALAAGPLRILTPRNHGTAAWAYTSTLGGGLVDGDRLRLRVRVGANASAMLASQGHNRVYRSGAGCSATLTAEVEEGALLAILPDPTVCFAGARYEQRTAVRLARGAAAVIVDVLAAGRGARGERWAFDRFFSDLSLCAADRVLLRERTLLDPRHGPLADRLGRFEAIGTIVLAGEPLEASRAEIGRGLSEAPLEPRSRVVEQANDLGTALHLRFAAVAIEDAIRLIRARLDFLPQLLGDDPWARRP